MRNTPEQIARRVVEKIAREKDDASREKKRAILKALGATGGGIFGGTLGGIAGSSIGSAIQKFPGSEPTTALGKALSKAFRNPVMRSVGEALPYAGLGVGLLAGGRAGYRRMDPEKKLTEEDLARLLDAYGDKLI